MKKSILLLLLIVAINAAAQKYVPFPTVNAEWNVKYRHESDYSPIKTLLILNYYINGDTIINSKTYKKVYGGSQINNLKGGIREENKRIYYFDFTNSSSYLSMVKPLSNELKNCIKQQITTLNNEFLLYDFNKTKTGDTLFVYPFGGAAIITNIDSIKIQNSYRKRYEYNAGWHGKDYVIEGIGSVRQGLFGVITNIPVCGGSFDWEFVCFSQNGQSVYKNPAYVDCNSTEKWSDRDYLKTGTQWYYGEKVWNLNLTISDDYNSLKSIGDTLINGQKCFKIIQIKGHPFWFNYQPTVFMYQSNDTVYFYNTTSKLFSTLYVYNANKGDSWTVKYPQGDIQVVVDSVTSLPSLGKALKVEFITYRYLAGGDIYKLSSKIIEGVGDENYLFMSNIFNLPINDDFNVHQAGLRCYVHPDYGTYHVPGTLDCSYVTEVPNLNHSSLKVIINSSGILSIEGESGTEPNAFELLDLKGSILIHTQISSRQNTINMNGFTKGLYMYRISNNGVMIKSGKVVKQ